MDFITQHLIMFTLILVGIGQAEALKQADVKIISNSGDPISGSTKVMDLFSSNGGTKVAGMLEALAQSDLGKGLLDKLGVNTEDDNQKH